MATLKELMSRDITTSQEGFLKRKVAFLLKESAFINQNHYGNLYKHTVFYLVRKYMNTMNKIHQPIQFDKPKRLMDALLKIQYHYKQLDEYITGFDAHIEGRREQFDERIVEYEQARQRLARQRIEDAVRRARGQEKPKPPTRIFARAFDLSSSDSSSSDDSSDESDGDEPERRVPRGRQGRPDADGPNRQVRPEARESDSDESPPPAQKRRRKAPYRFNIASTKGAFYQN